MRPSAPDSGRHLVKLNRRGFPGSLRTFRRPRRANVALACVATRRWIVLRALWALRSKAACGWTYASVSSWPRPAFGETGPPGISCVRPNSPAPAAGKCRFGMRGNTALNRARGLVSLRAKSSLWMDLCDRQLLTTAAFLVKLYRWGPVPGPP